MPCCPSCDENPDRQDAERARREHPDKCIGSRAAATQKDEEEANRMKARWCLPRTFGLDVMSKVAAVACHSLMMSQLSRALQDLFPDGFHEVAYVPKRYIQGRFLEAGPLQAPSTGPCLPSSHRGYRACLRVE